VLIESIISAEILRKENIRFGEINLLAKVRRKRINMMSLNLTTLLIKASTTKIKNISKHQMRHNCVVHPKTRVSN